MLRKTLIVSIVLAAGVVFFACSEAKEGGETQKAVTEGGDNKPAGPLTTIQFKDSVYDFGEGPQGKEVVHVFEFTNTGKNDLIIANAKAGCGCTVPKWPTAPIAPGQTGAITVTYNGNGDGPVQKTVNVTANTAQGNHVLTIKGYVKKKVDGPFKN